MLPADWQSAASSYGNPASRKGTKHRRHKLQSPGALKVLVEGRSAEFVADAKPKERGCAPVLREINEPEGA